MAEDTLGKLRQLTSALPVMGDKTCLELGIYEDIEKVVDLEMFDDKDVAVRRSFYPKGKPQDDYEHDGVVEYAVVYKGDVTFMFDAKITTCSKGGIVFIFPGERVSIEGQEDSWVLFIRILSSTRRSEKDG